jgi:mono/diheme cytochrome c family protein
MIRTVLAMLLAGVIMGGAARAQDGEEIYAEHCASCHGEKLRSTGAIPDLRELGDGDRGRFDRAVLEGRGQMPAWEGVLSPDEIDQVWAYLRRNAR